MKKPFKIFKNIKKARVSSGLSQKQLAKRLGVSDKTVSAYETGRAFPPTLTLTKIAEITKVGITQIMGVNDTTNKNDISEKLKSIENKLSNQTNGEELKQRIKIDSFVGVVLTDKDNRILLIKERDKYRISQGRWNLPGGSVDGEESLTEAAERETKEETGFKIKVKSLVGCYKCKKGGNSWIYVVFSAKLIGNSEEKVDPEVKETKWFTKKEFLSLSESRIVHPDMKLVYNITINNKGLSQKSVKLINYDKE